MDPTAPNQPPPDERSGTGAPPLPPEVRFDDLPALRSPLAPAAAIDALDHASRRGKLPGFKRESSSAFSVAVFGEPFDRRLHALISPDGPGSRLELRARLLLRAPIIAAVVLIFTIWPGVWLTDSMLLTYYPPAQHWWPTWTWYLPLTVIPLPFAARSIWKRSEASCRREAHIAIERIREATSATPITQA